MDKINRKFVVKTDIGLFFGLLALAALLYFLRPVEAGVPAAEISVSGRVVRTVDLSVDGEFTLDDIRFKVSGGKIAFIESNCQDKVCVNTGFIGRPGQMAACMPNRVAIRIISLSMPNDVDAVAK